MLIFCLLIIPISLFLIRLILALVTRKYGKFSYRNMSIAGFIYDEKNDVFYSSKNAWQRNFGYSRIYDEAAPLFRMIIDTEFIRFNYNNENYLIAFWKGQYGITTGAEIGIYKTNERRIRKNTLYMSLSDSEMLNMDFALYNKDKLILRMSDKHWWLAAFKLGLFSNPKDLSMIINITFLNKDMLEAFLQSFLNLGYKNKDYKVIDNTFIFKFTKPRTPKIWTRNLLIDAIRQYFNKKNVELYNKILDGAIDSKGTNKKEVSLEKYIPPFLKESINQPIYWRGYE